MSISLYVYGLYSDLIDSIGNEIQELNEEKVERGSITLSEIKEASIEFQKESDIDK